MKRSSSLVAIGFLMAVIGATPAHLRSQATTGATAAASDSVRLDTGLVSGTAGTSAEIRVYKGIPFAAPPVGARRWRARSLRQTRHDGPSTMRCGPGSKGK